jgi:hypothetical protein
MKPRGTLLGTVKTFEWTNPHCWIQLLVRNPDGTDVEWGIELLSPRLLVRTGWKVGDVKVGDKITVVVHRGVLEDQMMIEDPVAFTHPWKGT